MKKVKIITKALIFAARASPCWFVVITISTMLDGILPVALVWYMRQFIDWFVLRSGGLDSFLAIIGKWILVIVLQAICASVARYSVDRVWSEASTKIGMAIIEKSASFEGISQYETEDFHDTAAMLEKADYRIENLINNYYYLLKNCVQFVAVFSLLFMFQWWVPIVIGVSVIPTLLLSLKSADRRAKMEEEIEKKERRAYYFKDILISPRASKEVRVFDAFPFFKGKYQKLSTDALDLKLGFLKKRAGADLGASLVRVLAAGILVLYTAVRTFRGEITIGYLSLFTQSVFQISEALFALLEFSSYLSAIEPFFARLFGFFDLNSGSGKKADTRKKIGTIENIEFRNVSFSYPNGTRALEDVSFSLKKGEVTALVGENGSGKTTLVKLLAGLYVPTSGRILVNDIDLGGIDCDSYRSRLSAVFQDYVEFAMSVKENIALADVPDEDFRDNVGRIANKMDFSFVKELPGEWRSPLGLEFGGSELSGGQWQRLAILRGLYKKNDVLLVDEPTASIDPKQEAAVFRDISQFFSGITVLVTHRLGSIRLSSKILVLKNGRIVESGTHEELLGSGGHYADLYNAQAGMYR